MLEEKDAMDKACKESTVNGKTLDAKKLQNNLNTSFNKGTIYLSDDRKKVLRNRESKKISKRITN